MSGHRLSLLLVLLKKSMDWCKMRTKTWHFICLFQTLILIHDPCDLTSAIEVYLEERDDGAQVESPTAQGHLDRKATAWLGSMH